MVMVSKMELLKEYNINFKEDGLIQTALTHSSYAHEKDVESYERLEYLGDAVLELVTSHYLYSHTKYPEGHMSKIRSAYVCETALDEYAKKINLKDYIKLGCGIKEANSSVIADVFEAVIGVIYLENGYEEVEELFNKLIVPYIKEEDNDFLHDYKSRLQELVQTDKQSVEYVVTKEKGPAHNRTFDVDVIIEDKVFGSGTGKSKKQAEQMAAKDAFDKMVS